MPAIPPKKRGGFPKRKIAPPEPPHKLRQEKVSAKKTDRAERQGQLLELLAETHFTSISTEDEHRLETELKEELEMGEDGELAGSKLWQAVDSSEHHLVVEDSKNNYLNTWLVAWKLYEYVSASKERLRREIPKLAERAGIKMTAKFDPLIATFRATIKYDDRRQWSRDAQAVRRLKRDNVPPRMEAVLLFKEKHPGAVDAWAREEQAHNKAKKLALGESASPKNKTAAAALAKLRKDIEDGQGAVMMVKKNGPMLVKVGIYTLTNRDRLKVPQERWAEILEAIKQA